MRISDWSSDVCSSDLEPRRWAGGRHAAPEAHAHDALDDRRQYRADAGRVPWPHGSPPPAGRPLGEAFLVVAVRERGSSEERRVGKECDSTCRSRWSPYHKKKKTIQLKKSKQKI